MATRIWFFISQLRNIAEVNIIKPTIWELTINELGINKIINADEEIIVRRRIWTNRMEYRIAFLELRKTKIINEIKVAISLTK